MIKEEKMIRMRDGVELFTRIKEVGSPIWIVATHGIGEHSERHNYLLDLFAQYFNIFQYDLRGHGKSGGARADVKNFSEFNQDLEELLKFLVESYRMKRYLMFGHSMGALITAGTVQNYMKEIEGPEKIFFCAPPAGYSDTLGKLIDYLPAHIFDKIGTSRYSMKLGGLVDLNYLSHDPRVKDNYIHDPLNELKIHTRLLFGMVHASKEVFSRPIRAKCPAFCVVGGEDRIVNPLSLKRYFENIEKTFQFNIIEGGYHELHNEIEKYRKPYFEILKNFFMECLYR